MHLVLLCTLVFLLILAFLSFQVNQLLFAFSFGALWILGLSSRAARAVRATGFSFVFPDLWDAYRNHIPPEERGDFIQAYHRRLTSPDPMARIICLRGFFIFLAFMRVIAHEFLFWRLLAGARCSCAWVDEVGKADK
jgi:hypothetical protein